MAGDHNSVEETVVDDEIPKPEVVARTVLMTGGVGGRGGQATGLGVGGRGGDGEGSKIDKVVAQQVNVISVAPSQIDSLPDTLPPLTPPKTVHTVKRDFEREPDLSLTVSFSPSLLAFSSLCLSLGVIARIFIK
ncbi:hypothetical protein MVEN_02403800 [Mycena venus]|uniref:Uncharacterized protein n=1 Tax=Mycena venus TaxID=2733690 RepID=A0A8H6X2E4_9AGAR|nr:hypothetical protein MVEN_02403800 [Mycena venus]